MENREKFLRLRRLTGKPVGVFTSNGMFLGREILTDSDDAYFVSNMRIPYRKVRSIVEFIDEGIDEGTIYVNRNYRRPGLS